MAKKSTKANAPSKEPRKGRRDHTNGTHGGRVATAEEPTALMADEGESSPRTALSNKVYLKELARLQIELVKLQEWTVSRGSRWW